MKKRTKKNISIALLIFTIIIVCLFLIRFISPTEIDDVSPGISCPEIQNYNPDVLYVIPNYNNTPISNNTEWCNYILSLNKTLGLHGITHTYREFLYQNITQEELNYGISEFEKCFDKTPNIFKSPHLSTSYENKQLIKRNNLLLKGTLNQWTHKVYHCNNWGILPNKLINIF